MGPDVYTDTYKAYKKGTQRISKWLVENAASNQGRTHVTDPNATETGPTHNTAERAPLVPLAREVVKKEPPVSLPDWFLPLLKDVIRKRAECTRVFLSMESDNESITRSNNAHEHFVGVLKQVLSILSKDQNSSPERKIPAKRAEHRAGTDSLTDLNKFSSLVIEEPEDANDSNFDSPFITSKEDSVAASNKPTIRRSVKTSTAELDQAEFEFACFSLAKDYFHVREHLRELWKSWMRKETSLVAASATTNIAVHSLRTTASFACEIPHTESLESTIESMESILRGLKKQNISKNRPDSFEHPKNINRSLLDLCKQLQLFFKGNPRVFLHDYKEDFSTFEWSETLSKGGPFYTVEEMHHIIRRAWPEMFILKRWWLGSKVDLPLDEISRAMTYETAKLELWVILAMDLFVDLHYTLVHKISHAWDELKASSEAVKAQLKRNNQMEGLLRATPSASIKNCVSSLERFILFATGIDAVTEIRTIVPELPEMKATSFYVMKHNPILCGTIQHQMLRNAQILGIEASNLWRSLTSGAHLYNALKQEGFFKGKWDDMETFMGFYKPRDIFSMETPQQPKHYVSAIQMSSGMGIADMKLAAKIMESRRVNGIEGSVVTERKIKRRRKGCLDVNTPLLEVLQERHYSDEDLGHALREAKHVLSSRNGSERGRCSQDLPELLTNSNATVEFLKAITETITSEEKQLWFNFLSLNWTCLTIFRQVRQRFFNDPQGGDIPTTCRSETQLYLVAQIVVTHIEARRYDAVRYAAQLITELGPEKQNRAQSYLSSRLDSGAKAHKR